MFYYSKINQIRFFKGKSFMASVIAITSCMILAFVFSLMAEYLVAYLNIKNDTDIGMDIDYRGRSVFESFSGFAFALFPLGIISCVFVRNYYRYRIYINIQNGLRSIFAYCLSEIAVLCSMSALIAVYNVIGTLVWFKIQPDAYADIDNMIAYCIYEFALNFAICLIFIFVAYFLGRAIWRSKVAIVIWVTAVYLRMCFLVGFLKAIKEIYVDVDEIRRCIIVFPDISLDLEVRSGDRGICLIYVLCSLVIHFILFVVPSVFLFRRRFEERKR